VRIACIEWTIVVEHSSSVDACDIQLVNNIQPAILARRPRFAITMTSLSLAMTPFPSAFLVIIVK
jgi:hypothetical protein